MPDEHSVRIKKRFAGLTEPRRARVTYPLINILNMALCTVMAAAWTRQKRAWLAKTLDLSSGIPSHDHFNAIFKAIKPAELLRCLLS